MPKSQFQLFRRQRQRKLAENIATPNTCSRKETILLSHHFKNTFVWVYIRDASMITVLNCYFLSCRGYAEDHWKQTYMHDALDPGRRKR